MKKIGIFTQPLISNYGGILQNYALQYLLKEWGYNVITINRLYKTNDFRNILMILKQKVFKHHNNKILLNYQTNKIYENCRNFIDVNINVMDVYNPNYKLLNKICRNNFDTVIVGSDQVWRPDYVRNITEEFFDFLENDTKINRISYAASFGLDRWSFNEEQTNRCKKLIDKFSYVSVREKSGIGLCKNYLNKEADLVLDPTLLIDKEVYIELCKNIKNDSNKNVFTYILDPKVEKNTIIQDVADFLNLDVKIHQSKYELAGNADKNNLVDFKNPGLEGWIKGFMDAEFIITDSFHGTVFSIIFNKPFISIVNEERGASRFRSLLDQFNLSDRLISEVNPLDINICLNKIDYSEVNLKLDVLKEKSKMFLRRAIEDN